MRYTEILESTNSTFSSATKTRNFLVKKYGVVALRSWGASNAYSDVQSLNFKCDAQQAKLMKDDLLANGWAIKDSDFLINGAYKLVNPSVKDVSIVMAGDGKSGTVHGPKKAKVSNLPYYD